MNVNVKFESSLYRFFGKKFVVFVSLLFLLVLFFLSFISVTNGASVVPDVVVGNETELFDAISVAPNKKSHVISLNENVTLKSPLEISKNKNITLAMFGSAYVSVCLIGSNGVDTIVVKSGGVLELLGGVIVTHAEGDIGRGVYVESKGTLILSGGEISGNTVVDSGGGVYNVGRFVMYDGVIVNNNASFGGGMYNSEEATFEMFGGEITRNTAFTGGGVEYSVGSVSGDFILSGGKIFDNTATEGPDPDFSVIHVDKFPYFGVLHLLFIGLVIAIIGCVLLFYRLKKRK
jgi:hypothetical protein